MTPINVNNMLDLVYSEGMTFEQYIEQNKKALRTNYAELVRAFGPGATPFHEWVWYNYRGNTNGFMKDLRKLFTASN